MAAEELCNRPASPQIRMWLNDGAGENGRVLNAENRSRRGCERSRRYED